MSKTFQKALAMVLATAVFIPSVSIAQPSIAKADNTNIVSSDTEQRLIIEKLWDFEDEEDLKAFAYPAGAREQSDTFAYGGDYSLKVSRNETTNLYRLQNNVYGTPKQPENAKTGKVVTAYFYDADPSVPNQVLLTTDGADASKKFNKISVGLNVATNQYSVGQQGENASTATFVGIKDRSQGWHKFVIDFSVAGEVTVSVDDVSHKLTGSIGEEYGFTLFHIQDSWKNNIGDPSTDSVYFDDISVGYYDETESSQITPSKPITYDLENMIGFTPIEGKESYTNYEYSLTSGNGGWVDCESNPQIIPDKDYAIGEVAVRLKQEALDQSEFPPIYNEVAFTSETGLAEYFETDDSYKKWTKGIGAIGLSEDYSRSGSTSLAFIAESAKKFNYTYNLGKYYENAKLSIWYYDEVRQGGSTEKMQFNVSNSKAGTGTGGVNNNAEKISFKLDDGYYAIRTMNGDTTKTSVKRTVGWHNIVFDYSDGNNVVVYIDDVNVATMPSKGFDFLSCQDSWATTNVGQKYRFDDLSITTNGEVITMPESPTNGVVNDTEKTFGFTPLSAFPEFTSYEYTTNAGQTWSECFANPQPVGNNEIPAGAVQVRLKAINGQKAGVALKSKTKYESSSVQVFLDLQEKIDFTNGFFDVNLVKGDAFDTFKKALETAKTVKETDSESVITSAYNNLVSSIDALEIDLDNYTRYDFEENAVKENPFFAVTGALDVGGINTAWGEDEFDYYKDKVGTKMTYELENGKYVGEAVYTFPKDLDDKIVSLAWQAVANVTATTEITISDSLGNSIGIKSLPGNQTNYKIIKTINNVTTTEDLAIRRLDNPHIFYWDMANNDESVKFYLDQRELAELDGMTKFNKISIKVYGGTKDTEFTTFDYLRIIEKNPVEKINIADEKATIGYYETYDMPQPLLDIDAKYDDYKTTDILHYTSADEKIVNVTSGGSCEGMSFGTTDVTVTSQSGISDTVSVEVKDFKIEDIYITNSPIVDIIAMGKPGQDKNNSLPVEKLEEIVIEVNESKALNVVMTPVNATARLVEWISADENIVNVTDGLITGVNYGETIVTIQSNDGTNKTDTVKVIVKPDSMENGLELFVAKDGDDMTGTGSIDKPFASIERARDEARTLTGLLPNKGIVVYFREGDYKLVSSVEFNDQDSGTTKNPIKYSAYKDEKVTFVGGAKFGTTELEKVSSDDKMYNRLPSSSKSSVYKIDLAKFGIQKRDLQVVGHSAGGLKSFPEAFGEWNFNLPYFSVLVNGEPTTLSRYPNEDYIQTTTIHNDGENPREWQADPAFEYVEGMEEDTFIFSSSALSASKLASWSQSIGGDYGAWMSGYWGQVYSDQTVPMASIDGNKITSGLCSQYEPKPKMNFYVYNLIEELDIAGEWYIDQTEDDSLNLYIFPPKGLDMADASNYISIPTLDEVMIDMYETDNIMFTNIDMSSTNKGILSIEGGTNNVIRKSEIDNSGGKLVNITDSKNEIAKFNGLQMCNIKNIDGGVGMDSGDSDILERGYNFVENTSFYNFSLQAKSYNPAISLNGVGNRVTNCVFEESPHNVIMFSGPESIMEFNEFSKVIQTAGDQGAIYTGRDTLNRGSVIRNNYFHDIHHTTSVENSGVYLDDAKAGVLVHDNIFENVGQGLKFNGGRDVSVIGNEFINLTNGLTTTVFCYVFSNHIHDTALGLYCNANNKENITTVPWSDPNSAYGRFEHLYYALEDEFQYGKYCKLIDNVFYNMERTRDTRETIIDYNLWSKSWGVTPTYEYQKNLINDWFFDKDNDKSNNTNDQYPEYLKKYNVNVSVASGKGSVSGSDTEIVKGIERKVVATADSGFEFKHWVDASGNVVSENPVLFMTINSDVNLKAVFEAK